MMEDVRITDRMREVNEEIPTHQKPGRYAVATNLLCIVKYTSSDQSSLLVLNYEPSKWNQWYPFYSTINDAREFSATRFGDLCDEFASVLTELVGTSKDRLLKARREFQELYKCGVIAISDTPVVAPEHWLKFSKTANIWTYYLMEFYCVTSVEYPAKLLQQEDIIQALAPIEGDKLSELLDSGELDGVPLVANTLELLSDDDVIQKLKMCAIET